jgi:hypothetical protein
VANGKIYIHEFIDIIKQNRAKYLHHIAANWGPLGRVERNMLCFGVWATVGTTEKFPEATNLWELDGWDGLADNWEIEYENPKHQDATLEKWWAEAADMRHGGWDRVLIPAEYSPTLNECIERGINGRVYYHETIKIAPGQARTYLDLMQQEWLPVAERIGMRLAFAARSAMVNDSEVICIWAMKNWRAWAAVEKAYQGDAEVAQWRARTRSIALDWRNKLLSPAPLCPLNTGKIL